MDRLDASRTIRAALFCIPAAVGSWHFTWQFKKAIVIYNIFAICLEKIPKKTNADSVRFGLFVRGQICLSAKRR